jgi:hypothetical protein
MVGFLLRYEEIREIKDYADYADFANYDEACGTLLPDGLKGVRAPRPGRNAGGTRMINSGGNRGRITPDRGITFMLFFVRGSNGKPHYR